MPTMEDVAKQPREQRVARLTRTADDLAAAVRGKSEDVLARRPDAKNWAAKEVVCHLRDTEELFMERFQLILAMNEPKLSSLNPDRWAEERQYLRNDVNAAVAAFRTRRDETLELLRKLAPEAWQRAGLHATRGKFTVEDFVTLMAWHDDNHLDQLTRALDGKA
jgi:uncharacterized damage-inducible protein DinB